MIKKEKNISITFSTTLEFFVKKLCVSTHTNFSLILAENSKPTSYHQSLFYPKMHFLYSRIWVGDDLIPFKWRTEKCHTWHGVHKLDWNFFNYTFLNLYKIWKVVKTRLTIMWKTTLICVFFNKKKCMIQCNLLFDWPT